MDLNTIFIIVVLAVIVWLVLSVLLKLAKEIIGCGCGLIVLLALAYLAYLFLYSRQ